MSAEIISAGRKNIRDIASHKGKEPLVVLTAYTTPVARILDPHVDMLLVGDSLGMVLHGLPTTVGVTLEMMILHGQAVMRGSSLACVVIDMPFGSYQESPEQAYRNAARIMMETGCGAVKIEGGVEMANTVEFLSKRGIPVVGHVGLKPQFVHGDGGYRTKGRNEREAEIVIADSRSIADAGAFALVIEGTIEALARKITAEIAIPTIGIGASMACDGQVLVIDDMLGLSGMRLPKFVKSYARLEEKISKAVACYADEVRKRVFPAPEHCYGFTGNNRSGI